MFIPLLSIAGVRSETEIKFEDGGSSVKEGSTVSLICSIDQQVTPWFALRVQFTLI